MPDLSQIIQLLSKSAPGTLFAAFAISDLVLFGPKIVMGRFGTRSYAETTEPDRHGHGRNPRVHDSEPATEQQMRDEPMAA